MSRLTKFGEPRYIPAVPGVAGRPYSRTCPLPVCYGGANEVPGVNCRPPAAPGGGGSGSRPPPPQPGGSGGSGAGGDGCRWHTALIAADDDGNGLVYLIWVCP